MVAIALHSSIQPVCCWLYSVPYTSAFVLDSADLQSGDASVTARQSNKGAETDEVVVDKLEVANGSTDITLSSSHDLTKLVSTGIDTEGVWQSKLCH